jgi:predicted TIM-barrel fold metal-dependent hydrolase
LYNDWTANYCSEAPDRLFPLACLQLYDLDAAIAEMERAKNLGHVGVCIPATAPPDRLYSDPWYDKFWQAAQEMKMPLTMHIFTGATPNHGLPFPAAMSGLAFAGVVFTVRDLIFSGVCERFPDLKFVITEFETGWVGITLKRLDWNWFRGGGARTQAIPRRPSEYWKQNFLVTFEDARSASRPATSAARNTLMWGSDYPHGSNAAVVSFPVRCRRCSCLNQPRNRLSSRDDLDATRLAQLSGWPAKPLTIAAPLGGGGRNT